MGIFCNHEYRNIGSGYDDLWECIHCKKTTERNPQYGHILSSLTCSHLFEPYGIMDDTVRCVKCGKVKDHDCNDEMAPTNPYFKNTSSVKPDEGTKKTNIWF